MFSFPAHSFKNPSKIHSMTTMNSKRWGKKLNKKAKATFIQYELNKYIPMIAYLNTEQEKASAALKCIQRIWRAFFLPKKFGSLNKLHIKWNNFMNYCESPRYVQTKKGISAFWISFSSDDMLMHAATKRIFTHEINLHFSLRLEISISLAYTKNIITIVSLKFILQQISLNAFHSNE